MVLDREKLLATENAPKYYISLEISCHRENQL